MKSTKWTRCVFVYLSALIGMQAAEALEVQGHRGARSMRPENTMAAFRYAIENGVPVLELDLQVTRDDVLVVSHDPYVNPVICLDSNKKPIKSEVPVAIRSLKLKQVQKYDCGSLENPHFPKQVASPGSKIPTFRAVLKLARAKGVRLNVETKIKSTAPDLSADPATFAKLLYRDLKAEKMLGRTVVQSFDPRTLEEMRKLNPKTVISYLSKNPSGDLDLIEKGSLLSGNRPEIFSPDFSRLGAGDVERAKKLGMRVIVWTLNEVEAWERAVQMKVDGIISDDPVELLKFNSRTLRQ